jgi:hypothetical protein
MLTVSILGLTLIGAWHESRHAASLLAGLLLCAGPVVMFVAGLLVRRQEEKVNKLLNILEVSPDCEIDGLVHDTKLAPEQIKIALKRIADLGIAYYEWDETLRRIYDRRLLDQYVFVNACPSCGGAVGHKYSLILARVPECDYCGKPYELTFWNALRFGVMNSITKNNLELYRLDTEEKAKDINVPLTIMLFFVFWPAGVLYLMSRTRVPSSKRL